MASPTRPKIEYVLFDMDGLMIDSERIYTEVTNEILGRHGKTMTWDIKAGCMGKPEKDAIAHLLSFFPDIQLDPEDYALERNRLQDAAWPSVQLLPGIERLVAHLHAHHIPIAVATGSRRSKYALKTAHLGHVFERFGAAVVCGDDLADARGKPAPDIFLAAARGALGRDVGVPGVEATEGQVRERAKGLVFEDAMPGMQAGKRAGMNVVWVPDVNLLDVPHDSHERPDQILRSVEEFVPEEWGLPPYSATPPTTSSA
ncbi:HAD-like protein [Schizophyllum commune H4-8]|uniref:HAD-like protein n=1 Tax=Schizophyllum commune (strain H4-8 / FGSC 9210) TaxID=578458 RepID=D8QBF7_SCHCM|nr:HAD-like protein [Schizophyllum commune H4-8]KAI5889158.1 HAD-like protein [Schizophyllum commune H4-8]